MAEMLMRLKSFDISLCVFLNKINVFVVVDQLFV